MHNMVSFNTPLGAGVAQSVERLSTGWMFGERGFDSHLHGVQTDSGAQPASYPMGTGDFPEVKRPRREANHSLSSAEVKNSCRYNCTPPNTPS
jgi:hypothetical protein